MDPGTSKGTYTRWLQAALIAAASLWAFYPAMHGWWLMDDELYLPHNPLLNDPARLWKIWFAPGSFIEYYPIEETAQWAQWQLWGLNSYGYHLTNVVVHIVNALLVWRLLSLFGLRLAWQGGLIFAIHPVQVETVAWMAEFKSILSLTPLLCAMCVWIEYEERKWPADYLLALGLFLTAMLCKISAAPFPAIILLYTWWKRGRIGLGDVKAMIPFLIVSLALVELTIMSGAWFRELHHTTADPIPLGGFWSRVACAGMALGFYIAQCFWPVGLLPNYPQWTLNPLSWWEFLPWLVLLAGVSWFWSQRQSWGKHALLGLGFFFFFILPFLGFIGISYMAFTRVMDHFLYLPIIGLIGLTVGALEQLGRRLSQNVRTIGIGVTALVVAVLACESHAYAYAFVSREENNRYVIERAPQVWIAHNNLGVTYLQTEQIDKALTEFAQAVALNPTYAAARNNFGNALIFSGRVDDAIDQYQEAVFLEPDYAEAHNGLGNALLQAGRLSQAITECEEALRLNPDYAEAHCTLGLALAKSGRLPEAIGHFQTALKLQPGNPQIAQALAELQEQAGQKN